MRLRTSTASKWSPWLWACAVVLVVTAAGLGTRRLLRDRAGGGTGGADRGTPATATAPARLTAGHDYYLHVKLIEVADRRPDGKGWDRVGDSGPDVKFTLTWKQNVVWSSAEKSDTLIASWDLLKIDLRQVIASGGQADLEDALNAPLVQYEPGATVELKVWDSDTVGSDDIGTLVLNLDDLSPGENTLYPSAAEGGPPAMRRVVLSLIDRRTSLPELVEAVSNR